MVLASSDVILENNQDQTLANSTVFSLLLSSVSQYWHLGFNRMGRPRLPDNSSNLVVSLLCVRIISAFYNLIYDCDETYNYWEIGHYLIFKNGYVTWEYSPQYALRSYLYIWFYVMPSFIVSFLTSNEKILFYLTRLIISLFGVFCELNFCM